ncbi:MAG TPA: hypothetical protein DIC34_18955 [Treponema sp.]|nr:hypothetical protein [Treponema sp.]
MRFSTPRFLHSRYDIQIQSYFQISVRLICSLILGTTIGHSYRRNTLRCIQRCPFFAKPVNHSLKKDRNINPMIGACGISAFPISV